jgi:hypothetical protein
MMQMKKIGPDTLENMMNEQASRVSTQVLMKIPLFTDVQTRIGKLISLSEVFRDARPILSDDVVIPRTILAHPTGTDTIMV